MNISFLADRSELVQVLANRLLEERRAVTPELTLEWRIAKLQTHLNVNTLPIAWVAHEGSQLLGTAALRLRDLEGRDDLSPWLGGVYVVPEARRAGIGTALCAVVESQARTLGYKELYLFTLDRQGWYEKLGWTIRDLISCRGVPGVIMQKRLDSFQR